MAEKPIIFSGPMVRAILEGRKTQTRRVVKPQPVAGLGYMMGRKKKYAIQVGEDYPDDARDRVAVRYPIGTRLWVRETWRPLSDDGAPMIPNNDGAFPVEYRADFVHDHGITWRSSMFMPRWASRITLEVTDVRVQRVQEISEEDALAEGVSGLATYAAYSMRDKFQALWNEINAKRGFDWVVNPWVFAYTFKVLEVRR